MYNQLFTKILDSSIWLEPTPTRLVWVTLIAAMDRSGLCQFASVANLAHRARVTVTECNKAVETLEAPDPNSSDPDNEGRRIKRVPGGWLVLNAPKYKGLMKQQNSKEKGRLRTERCRARKKSEESGNASVTPGNGLYTPEAHTESGVEAEAELSKTVRCSERPNGSKDSSGGKSRQARGPSLDLREVDWGAVRGMAESVGKMVPLRKAKKEERDNDRRQWIKYAALVSLAKFPLAWLMNAADKADRSPSPKKSKAAIFVSELVETSGMEADAFNELVRSVNVPRNIWKSDILGGPSP